MNTSTLRSVVVGSLMCLAPLVARAVEFDQQKLTAIPDAIQPLIAENEISGAVTCLVTKTGVVHTGTAGRADVAANRPMQSTDLFWIASMTKPVTGVAIMMLQDEGKLSVSDPVSKYIPEFAGIKTKEGKPANITIQQLMSHTAGLVDNTREDTRAAKTLADLIPPFVKEPTQFEPGTQWRYSQTAINSLGRIVEVVSGQSYPEFLDKRLLGPLGMKDTTFYPSPEQQKRIAKSYTKNKEGKLQESPIFIFAGRKLEETDRVPLANGGLFSTAPDYARFCQMLLNDGALDGKTYLKPETVKQMRTPVTGEMKAGFIPGSAWALTVGVVKEPTGVTATLSPGTYGHGGAYGTQAWIDPTTGVAYVLMIQRANFANMGGADGSAVRKAFQEAAAKAMK
jgi:CubicO group peptidase (beta-lactamase class C family)